MNTIEAVRMIRVLDKVIIECKYDTDPGLRFLNKLHEAGFMIAVNPDHKPENLGAPA